MNIKTSRLVAIFMIATLIVAMPTEILAIQENPTSNIQQYTPLNDKSKIDYYIRNADEFEEVMVLDNTIKYYKNNDYTLVFDSLLGYFLLTFTKNENDFIEVKINGIEVGTNAITNNNYSYNLLSTDSWSHLKTTRRCYNVAGMSPGVIGGLIGGIVGGKIAQLALGALSGVIIDGIIGYNYYICVKTIKEYKIVDVFLDKINYRTTYYVYKGKTQWESLWFKI